MIAPLVAAVNFLFQSKQNKPVTKRELSEKDKEEIKKIDQMGFFEAMDYLVKKK